MKRKRYTRAEMQMQMQLQMIEKLLSTRRMTAARLMHKTRLGKHALHNRLRILRNDGRVRYDQEGGTVIWSLGTMPALESKPKNNRPASDVMLKWGGWTV